MKNFLIKQSLNLKNNESYQKKKQFFRSLLENRETSHTKYFDSFMIVLILFSVFVLVLNKTYSVPSWILFIDIFIVSSIFLLEYLLRFWIFSDIHVMIEEHTKKDSSLLIILWDIIKRKLSYVFSITGIIDLLAIFPQFRIVRLLKLYHYLYGAKTLLKALSKKEFEFKFLGYILVTVVFSFASVLYVVEHGINKNITSFLDALYWALVTVFTVGYGDISPVTDMGKIISMVGIIFGIAMISFVTSVMVSAFAERFDELRTHSSINSLYNMNKVVIINGYGYLGSRIAYYIRKEKRYNCVIIEEDKEKSSYAQTHGQTVIYGDGCSTEIMKTIYRRNNIVAMLTLKSSDIDNIYFILNAKSYNEKSLVFSRISHQHLLSQYNSIKTDLIIDPYSIIHKRAFSYAQHYLKSHVNRRVVLFGYSPKSKHLASKFKNYGIDIKIYDSIEEEVESAKLAGFEAVELINFENSKHLEILALEKNNLIICSMHDEALNHYLAISLKVNEFNGKIMALTDTKQSNRQLKLAGADVIFDLYDESAKVFIENLNKIEDKV
jgi:voltage-gated potassium channel